VKRAALAVVLLTSCGGPRHQIIEDTWDIPEAWAAPELTEITDLGGSDVPQTGNLVLQGSDGVATIGETLWLRGKGFGRQPSVSVGGRPAAVLGRTRDGGALVRVPPGTPSGSQPVVVSNEVGKGERPIAIRRYAAVMPAEGNRVGWAEIAANGPIAAGTTPVSGGRLLALSADGRAAYVAEMARSVVNVLEIPAAGAPRVSQRLDLGAEPVVALCAAARAPVLAVVRLGDVILLDTSSPLRPVRGVPRAFPTALREARLIAADLSPDGRYLAAITERGNALVLIDVAARAKAAPVAEVALLGEVRVPVLIDVAFSPDGQTVWALAGDTDTSRAVGPQPTQVFAVRVAGDPRAQAALTIARVVTISGAANPMRISTGRAMPLVSGSAIRLPPEKATVFISAQARVPAGVDAKTATAPATIFRLGAEDAASDAATAAGTVGKADLSPDGRWLLAAASSDGGLNVISAPADFRPGEHRSVQIVAAGAVAQSGGPAASGSGARPPELRVQP
jgi:hypothetical protein